MLKIFTYTLLMKNIEEIEVVYQQVVVEKNTAGEEK
jgi:hypothetical protein